LEFDRVLITELERRSPPNNFVYDRDPQTFCPARICPAIAQKLLPAVTPEMRTIAERDRDRRFREELCVLYVAMTRAKYELQIIVEPTRPTKSGSSSWPRHMAGLIRAALCDAPPLSPDTIAFETGRSDWYRDFPDAKSEPADAESELPLFALLEAESSSDPAPRRRRASPPLQFASHSGTTASHLDAVAPSQLEGGNVVSGAHLFSASRDKAMEIGTLMHGWFELIQWIADADDVPSYEQLRRVAIAQSVRFDQRWIERFRELLRRPNIAGLLNEAAYRDEMGRWLERDLSELRVEPLNEHPITHADGQRLLTGSIDRLVVIWDRQTPVAADIIDYKTDEVTDQKEAEHRAAHYAPQLEAYRAAIASMLHLKNDAIRARLLFTQSDRLVAIPPKDPAS
jgi:ATP-dependent exoDNAse (exonuclease V) beta subunit